MLGAIALDTEFVRTDTFYPKPGLIQVSTGREVYLVDPIVLAGHAGFSALLANRQVTKVLHSCSEDLEVLRACFGVLPEPVFDTQLAAAFCGFGFSIGYANLVKTTLNLELPKDATRSDWLVRPLGEVQKRYAALDVAHLLVVYGNLLAELKAQQRLAWVLADCQTLLDQASDTTEVDPDYYLKVKHAWRLNRSSLQVLRALCQWREIQARARNVPRNRVLKDAVLFDIAQVKPPHLAKLSTIDGVTGRFIRDAGTELLQVIKTAVSEPQDQWPQSMAKPLPKASADLGKKLKAIVAQQAEKIALPTEVLVRKADLQTLLQTTFDNRAPALSERLARGWRNEVIGQQLLSAAQNYCRSELHQEDSV